MQAVGLHGLVAQGNALGKWWIRVCVRGMGCVCPDDGTTLPRKGIVTANEKFHVVAVSYTVTWLHGEKVKGFRRFTRFRRLKEINFLNLINY